MCGLGMTSSPFEQAAGIFVIPHIDRGIDLKICTLGRRKMGKIGAHKVPVILLRPCNVGLSFLLRSLRNLGRRTFNVVAMLNPSLLRLFVFSTDRYHSLGLLRGNVFDIFFV